MRIVTAMGVEIGGIYVFLRARDDGGPEVFVEGGDPRNAFLAVLEQGNLVPPGDFVPSLDLKNRDHLTPPSEIVGAQIIG